MPESVMTTDSFEVVVGRGEVAGAGVVASSSTETMGFELSSLLPPSLGSLRDRDPKMPGQELRPFKQESSSSAAEGMLETMVNEDKHTMVKPSQLG